GLEDFGPVGHGAEHVGDVAAVAQGAVVDGDRGRANFAAVQSRNAWHKYFLRDGSDDTARWERSFCRRLAEISFRLPTPWICVLSLPPVVLFVTKSREQSSSTFVYTNTLLILKAVAGVYILLV